MLGSIAGFFSLFFGLIILNSSWADEKTEQQLKKKKSKQQIWALRLGFSKHSANEM